jgi:hypothetical protein
LFRKAFAVLQDLPLFLYSYFFPWDQRARTITGHLLRDHELRPRSQWRLVDLCVDLGTIWEQDGTSMEYMEYCILNGSF